MCHRHQHRHCDRAEPRTAGGHRTPEHDDGPGKRGPESRCPTGQHRELEHAGTSDGHESFDEAPDRVHGAADAGEHQGGHPERKIPAPGGAGDPEESSEDRVCRDQYGPRASRPDRLLDETDPNSECCIRNRR
jgi:hypothetical protein